MTVSLDVQQEQDTHMGSKVTHRGRCRLCSRRIVVWDVHVPRTGMLLLLVQRPEHN